jgi:cyclopropane fatty-acyl-phospholipid synthase-like methyltransferase
MTKTMNKVYYNPLFNNPLSSKSADKLLSALGSGDNDLVLDVGCGNGEMLLRLAREHRIRGFGVDPNGAMIDIAKKKRDEASLSGQLEFHHSRIQDCDHLPERFDHIICMGATHAFGDLGEALTNTLKSLARWFKPGSKALIGEGYWKREPAPSYLKFLKTRREQLRSLNDSLQHVREHGFQVCARHLSEGAEWDSFEEAFWRAAQLEAADNPRDPLIQEKFDRRRQWYDNYHRWGRSTMGFLSMVLSR